MNFLSVFYGYFIVNSYKVFALDKITNENFLNTIGAVSSACASLRFIFGFMMEKWSFKTCYTVLLITEITVTGTIYFAVNNGYWYMLWMCLSIWLEGGHFTLFPTVCGKLFGIHGPSVYAIGFVTFGFSSLSGILMEKVILGYVGYLGVFLICLAMQVVALIMCWTMFDEVPMKADMLKLRSSSDEDEN